MTLLKLSDPKNSSKPIDINLAMGGGMRALHYAAERGVLLRCDVLLGVQKKFNDDEVPS